jgi:hypothetical protein
LAVMVGLTRKKGHEKSSEKRKKAKSIRKRLDDMARKKGQAERLGKSLARNTKSVRKSLSEREAKKCEGR